MVQLYTVYSGNLFLHRNMPHSGLDSDRKNDSGVTEMVNLKYTAG